MSSRVLIGSPRLRTPLLGLVRRGQVLARDLKKKYVSADVLPNNKRNTSGRRDPEHVGRLRLLERVVHLKKKYVSTSARISFLGKDCGFSNVSCTDARIITLVVIMKSEASRH